MRFIAVCTMTAALAVLSGCETAPEAAARAEQRQRAYRQTVADQVVRDLVYFEDPRTGICFAYLWKGAANGGPALTTVPCERVPPDLLTTTMGEYE